jgi:hypothetical protein
MFMQIQLNGCIAILLIEIQLYLACTLITIAELESQQLNLDTWLVQIELKERYLEMASELEMFA